MEAIRLDKKKVVDLSDDEVLKIAIEMFNRYADDFDDQGNKKLSLAGLKNVLHKGLDLKKTFGRKFSDLANNIFVMLDVHKYH